MFKSEEPPQQGSGNQRGGRPVVISLSSQTPMSYPESQRQDENKRCPSERRGRPASRLRIYVVLSPSLVGNEHPALGDLEALDVDPLDVLLQEGIDPVFENRRPPDLLSGCLVPGFQISNTSVPVRSLVPHAIMNERRDYRRARSVRKSRTAGQHGQDESYPRHGRRTSTRAQAHDPSTMGLWHGCLRHVCNKPV